MTDPSLDRAAAAARDAADSLAAHRDRFSIPDPDLLYMDGNSLGRPPLEALRRVRAAAEEGWARGLVASWAEWIDEPARVGDALAPLIGASPGEVVLADQTSINLYKLAWAACGARPGRSVIVTDDANFPSDRYVLDGIAAAHGLEVRVVTSDAEHGTTPAAVGAALGPEVALVSLSLVAYKTAALADLEAITAAAHDHGALVLWDLSHAAGVVPIDLGGAGADLAVGCTYKYLNAGPGAPAFLYVAAPLVPELRQPVWGWFGHDDMFSFESGYRPAAGISRFLVGTPPILSLAAASAGIELVAEAGIAAIRAKSLALTDLLVGGHDAWLADLGFTLGSPRDPDRRGGHVSVRHPEAARISVALREHGVVADFRAPDTIRLAPSPLYTSFAETWDALARLRDVVESAAHLRIPAERSRVT